ncbi:toll/interleukin-1 receptor domain-containing protein [Hydrogenophaga sp.]|uniref:toll/interleukin-1 receptor domain-containing protein n=3 Tax=Hydrogenophaga sp. TaxID=1904254 RepID=UPI00271880BC|nr:toll/interleukin-1 receptor domain-containing protein [Hydrogenophaga sp.]MDO9135743.1 toll/interleukin-1 receptor domain-containing protein [Hydrogenophaga sp.]MDO9503775.1 toll/interleukin-1 receptor domain-containing protein [Hydrogenophaga sp.]MDP3626226.1 toll/interleukin-1 receptor domain-containing protein [Hydrogenophaga sp.]
MDGIFISYRRDDSAGYAGRLYDRLAAHFGADQVFMDVAGIELGTDFVTAIEQAVGSCKVLIVVIGDEWLSTTDAAGRRRLDDPHDFVRLETSVALEREIRVVPVLVGGALMPRGDELPANLKALARRQAIEISHKQWEASTRELIMALNTMLGQRADAGITEPGAVGGAPRETQAPVESTPSPAEASSRSAGRLLWAGLGASVLALGLWAVWPGEVDPTPAVASTTLLTAEAPRAPETPVVVAAAPAPTPIAAAAPAPETASPARPAVVAAASVVTAPVTVAAATTRPRPAASPATAAPLTTTRPTTQDAVARPRPVEPAAPAPIPAPATVAAVPERSPEVAREVNAALPRPGESWTYRTSGKWPTSPRRDIVISVQSVRDGLVTDTLRADAEARIVGDSRRAIGSRPGFLKWDQIGLEYSPYLGAFRDLGTLGSLSDFPTPEVDTWGQWYSQAKVLGRESVSVPGGSFDAFKVEVWSSRSATGGATQAAIEPVRIHYLIWYAPEVKRYVKMQRRVISAASREIEKDLFELVAHR